MGLGLKVRLGYERANVAQAVCTWFFVAERWRERGESWTWLPLTYARPFFSIDID